MTKMAIYFHLLNQLETARCKVKSIVLEDTDWHELRAEMIAARPYGNEPQPKANPRDSNVNPSLSGVVFRSQSQLDFLQDEARWNFHWEDGFIAGWSKGFDHAKKGIKK